LIAAAHEPAESQKTAADQMDRRQPLARQKHYLVSRVIEPQLPMDPVVSVEIEAVFSKATQVIAWRELQDDNIWGQGWV
jgi:tryptophan-rich hypothetical protein